MNRADLVAAAAALTKRSTSAQGIPARLENPVKLRRLAALFAVRRTLEENDRRPALQRPAVVGGHGNARISV